MSGQFTVERSLLPEGVLDRSIGSPLEVFVHVMEDALSIYRHPYEPDRLVAYMDEMSRQLSKHAHQPTRIELDLPHRHDYHYNLTSVRPKNTYIPRTKDQVEITYLNLA